MSARFLISRARSHFPIDALQQSEKGAGHTMLDVLADDDEVTATAEDVTDIEVLDCTELSTATREEADVGVPADGVVFV
jgi:hypothetical protein